MAKKSTGYTPTGREKTSPVEKQNQPMKAPGMKPINMPNPLNGGANNTATLPGTRFPKLTRPAPMAPRTPKI